MKAWISLHPIPYFTSSSMFLQILKKAFFFLVVIILRAILYFCGKRCRDFHSKVGISQKFIAHMCV